MVSQLLLVIGHKRRAKIDADLPRKYGLFNKVLPQQHRIHFLYPNPKVLIVVGLVMIIFKQYKNILI